MRPAGWEALGQRGDDVVRIEPLTGGAGVNEVRSVRVNGHLAVGRPGQRSDADLAWETGLLRYLDREGMPVPAEGGSPGTGAGWLASPARCAVGTGSRAAGPSGRAGDRRPAFCTPRPGRRPTSARCRLTVSSDARQQ